MKEYERILDNYVDQGHIFYEKVQRPENYLSIIKNKITELNKKEYKNVSDLIRNLNKKLGIEKIIFLKHDEKLKYSSGVVSVGYNPKTNEI